MNEEEHLRAAASDAFAFVELYRLHVTRVYRYHMAHVGIAKDAEDLTSQTFMAALKKLRSLYKSDSFTAGIMEIAARERHKDGRGNRRELPFDAALYYQNATSPTDRDAMRRRAMETTSRALKQISPDHAEAIILTYFCDLSGSEVSRILKKSTAAVQTLITRGIQDYETVDPDAEEQNFASSLIHAAGQITPNPLFVSELEEILQSNHQPKAKWTFPLQQIASLAGWALLIAAGLFLLNWRVVPNTSPTKPFIADTGNAKATTATDSVLGGGKPTSLPTLRPTATRLPTLEYVVQAGDTCTYIADQFGITIDELIRLNDLNDTCDIWIDQKLTIPVIPTSTPQLN